MLMKTNDVTLVGGGIVGICSALSYFIGGQMWYDAWAEMLANRRCDDVANFRGSQVRNNLHSAETYEMTMGEIRGREMLYRDGVENEICRCSPPGLSTRETPAHMPCALSLTPSSGSQTSPSSTMMASIAFGFYGLGLGGHGFRVYGLGLRF